MLFAEYNGIVGRGPVAWPRQKVINTPLLNGYGGIVSGNDILGFRKATYGIALNGIGLGRYYGDACDSCQTSAQATANADANDPNSTAGGGDGYDCSTFPACAAGTLPAASGGTMGPPAPTGSQVVNGTTVVPGATATTNPATGLTTVTVPAASSTTGSGSTWSNIGSGLLQVTGGLFAPKKSAAVASSSSPLIPILIAGGAIAAAVVFMNKKK